MLKIDICPFSSVVSEAFLMSWPAGISSEGFFFNWFMNAEQMQAEICNYQVFSKRYWLVLQQAQSCSTFLDFYSVGWHPVFGNSSSGLTMQQRSCFKWQCWTLREYLCVFFPSWLFFSMLRSQKGLMIHISWGKNVYIRAFFMYNLLPMLTFLDLKSDLFKNYCRSWCG